ncbi:MAG TPA: hypothetical protein DCZ34_00370 [Clostridiales bacterium]|nr:hypothetical protein [Clostridiales bacterium]
MIKIALLISLFAMCSYLGFSVGNTYLEKQRFYEDLLNFCQLLKNEISFLKTDIISIISKTTYTSKLNNILFDVSNVLISTENFSSTDLNDDFDKYSFLSEQDKKMLCDIFSNLGKLSYEEQIGRIEYNIASIDQCLKYHSQKTAKLFQCARKWVLLLVY